MDDILIQAENYEQLYERALIVLKRCRDMNMIMPLSKMECGEEISFAGHVVGSKGGSTYVKGDPDMMKAVSEFPRPQTATDVKSFLGLAQQLAWFVPELAHNTAALRDLTKKKSDFHWGEIHERDFLAVKKLLAGNLIVHPFDVNLPTELHTDASRLNGLGYALLQRKPDGQTVLISCGSCSVTDAQSRYAVIELECLGIQWAVQKCDYFLKGCQDFSVITDHKPLLGVFSKDIGMVENPRLQRLRMKLSPYSFTLRWTAGKQHELADALSRYPVFQPQAEDPELAAANRSIVKKVVDTTPCGPILKAASDDAYRRIIQALKQYKDSSSIHPDSPAAAYKAHWDNLSVIGEGVEQLVLLDSKRIVVPHPARKAVLAAMHKSHCGIVKTKKLAAQLFYWPGMNNEIEHMVRSCTACREMLPSQQLEPAKEQSEEPLAPMSHLGADFFELDGKMWLCVVDRFSGWPFAAKMASTTTEKTTAQLAEWFNLFGWPISIRSDGGPQFRSKFSIFCRSNGIEHQVSSPYNPQSNGLAEAGVKQVKYLLKKCAKDDTSVSEALAAYRNMPREDGFSPSQLMNGRRMRSAALPVLSQHLTVQLENVKEGRIARDTTAERAKDYYNDGTKALPPLQIGDAVVVQNRKTFRWVKRATVEKMCDSGHSYEVRMRESGKLKTRNRKFLRPDSQGENEGKKSAEGDECEPEALSMREFEWTLVVPRKKRQRKAKGSPPTRFSPRLASKASKTIFRCKRAKVFESLFEEEERREEEEACATHSAFTLLPRNRCQSTTATSTPAPASISSRSTSGASGRAPSWPSSSWPSPSSARPSCGGTASIEAGPPRGSSRRPSGSPSAPRARSGRGISSYRCGPCRRSPTTHTYSCCFPSQHSFLRAASGRVRPSAEVATPLCTIASTARPRSWASRTRCCSGWQRRASAQALSSRRRSGTTRSLFPLTTPSSSHGA